MTNRRTPRFVKRTTESRFPHLHHAVLTVMSLGIWAPLYVCTYVVWLKVGDLT